MPVLIFSFLFWGGRTPPCMKIFCYPCSALLMLCFWLKTRCTMERTPHPVSLATTHVTTCWARLLTVHQIACGWSSTATPPEPIRASASRTPVSCLTNKVLSRGGKARCFLLYLCFCSRFFFFFFNCWQKTKASLLPSFFLIQAHRWCKCNSLKLTSFTKMP